MKSLLLALLLACTPARGDAPHLQLQGVIADESVDPIVDVLEHAQGRVVLEIDSPGGSVEAGWKLAKAIERSPARVACVVDGEADSMAAVVLQSCDERAMTERSLLMFHEAGGGIAGQPDHIANGLNYLRHLDVQIARHCARRMRMSWRKFLAQIAHGHEWWMDCDEALHAHAVDTVVGSVRQVF